MLIKKLLGLLLSMLRLTCTSLLYMLTQLDFIAAMSPSSRWDILFTSVLKVLESDVPNKVL